MSVIQIDTGGTSLSKAEKLLAGIEGGIEKATRSAMQRAVSNLRTNSSKIIREKYDISESALRMKENVTVRYSYSSGIIAFVNFSGYKLPLFRYGGASPKNPQWDRSGWVSAMIQGKWRRVHPSLAASGHQLKSTSPTKFENAFVAQMESGHIGIFERTGGATSTGGDAIKEIMGSSIPQMLGNKEVEEKLAEKAREKFEERLDHEVNRILNGWGG